MNASYQRGFFNRLRIRLFGETDPVDRQLDEISRQGSGMARMAHVCSLALIVLFSLGSLVALGGDDLKAIMTQWNHGQVDIPSAISIVVSTLLVLCMDVGMVYAASMLRLLVARRASAGEMRLHQLVMAVVAILEASTYAYMSARYEHPANLAVWSLILARAAAAPLLSVYLALARQLPVLPRDVLYQVELAAGKGVLKNVTELANDPEASLTDLLVMYYASADMSDADRERLSRLAQAVQFRRIESASSGSVSGTESGSDFPTGGGSPAQVVEATTDDESEEPRKAVALERVLEPSVVVPLRPAAQRTGSSRRYPDREAQKAAGFALLDAQPNMSKSAFRRKLGINQARAREIYAKWLIEHKPRRTTPLVGEDVAQ